jgi:putative phosphoesterase
MKILVLSDSHSGLSFMRRCIRAVKPDVMIHLGDHFDDGEVMAEENPNIRIHQVPGNCDKYRMVRYEPEICCYPVGGVMLYMTHGHLHNVKQNRYKLLLDARKMNARAVLYGHTHIADCHREEDGLWVLNPGACGSTAGSVGLIEIENSSIISCKILHLSDLEEIV